MCASTRPSPGVAIGNTKKELSSANVYLKGKRRERKIQENVNWEGFKYLRHNDGCKRKC